MCNFYLAGLQAGLQSAHTQHELAIKYLASTPYRNLTADESLREYGARLDRHTDAKADYINWANNHKTLILLNGGMASDLIKFKEFLECNSPSYAWASFCEEEAALNGAMTNLGIVLPESMYKYTSQVLEFAKTVWPGNSSVIIDSELYLLSRDEAGLIHLSKNGASIHIYDAFDLDLLGRLSKLRLM